MKKNKKEQAKEKALIKEQKKKAMDALIKPYLERINGKSVELVLKVDEAFDKVNIGLSDIEVKLVNLRIELERYLSPNKFNIEEVNRMLGDFIDLDNKRMSIINNVLCANEEGEIYQLFVNSHVEIMNELDDIYNELKNEKNGFYAYTLTKSRAQIFFAETKAYCVEVLTFTQTYIDSLEAEINIFKDLVKSTKDIVKNDIVSFIRESEANNKNRYKERLRVEYYELERFLIHNGYKFARQNSTTHAIWKHKDSGKSITLPNKSKTIPQGTVGRILNHIGATRNELASFIKNKKKEKEKGGNYIWEEIVDQLL